MISQTHFNEPKPTVLNFNGESYPLKNTNILIKKKLCY